MLLVGCAGTGDRVMPEAEAPGMELSEVPFHPQDEDHCGPAALATVLGWSGQEVHPEALAPYLFLPERRGAVQPEMIAQARANGRLAWQQDGDPAILARELEAGHPVLVLKNLGLGIWPVWHYAVVVGLDPANDRVLLRSGTEKRKQARASTFERTWRRADYWLMVVLPPGEVPVSAGPTDYLSAAHDLEAAGRVDRDDMRAVWEAGIERWSWIGDFHLALSNSHLQAGDEAAAEDSLRSGLLSVPRDPMLSYNLAWLLASRGEEGEARIHAEAALALEGEFGERAEQLYRYLH